MKATAGDLAKSTEIHGVSGVGAQAQAETVVAVQAVTTPQASVQATLHTAQRPPLEASELRSAVLRFLHDELPSLISAARQELQNHDAEIQGAIGQARNQFPGLQIPEGGIVIIANNLVFSGKGLEEQIAKDRPEEGSAKSALHVLKDDAKRLADIASLVSTFDRAFTAVQRLLHQIGNYLPYIEKLLWPFS